MDLESVTVILLEMWRKALNEPALKDTDDIFEHGGHSMLVIRMSVQINEHFDVDISIAEMFDLSTVAKLSRRVSEKRNGTIDAG